MSLRLSGHRPPPGGRKSYLWFKHTYDRVAAALLLVATALPMLYLVWRIRRDSPGPALFRQTRAGKNGRPFTLYKFRTMRTDADPYGESPRDGSDPRVTPLGRRMREWSLDELPQLINVLRGEMSLVGPRPLYVQQIAEWNDRQRARLLVKPGLTGLAQINGRGAITIEQKLEFDVQYVENVSLRADFAILWRTIWGVSAREGIYEVRYSEKHERRGDQAGGEAAPRVRSDGDDGKPRSTT